MTCSARPLRLPPREDGRRRRRQALETGVITSAEAQTRPAPAGPACGRKQVQALARRARRIPGNRLQPKPERCVS